MDPGASQKILLVPENFWINWSPVKILQKWCLCFHGKKICRCLIPYGPKMWDTSAHTRSSHNQILGFLDRVFLLNSRISSSYKIMCRLGLGRGVWRFFNLDDNLSAAETDELCELEIFTSHWPLGREISKSWNYCLHRFHSVLGGRDPLSFNLRDLQKFQEYQLAANRRFINPEKAFSMEDMK